MWSFAWLTFDTALIFSKFTTWVFITSLRAQHAAKVVLWCSLSLDILSDVCFLNNWHCFVTTIHASSCTPWKRNIKIIDFSLSLFVPRMQTVNKPSCSVGGRWAVVVVPLTRVSWYKSLTLVTYKLYMKHKFNWFGTLYLVGGFTYSVFRLIVKI